MSTIGVPMVLAPVFGPTLGGVLLQSVGWHAIFLINIPIGIATTGVAMRLLPRDQPKAGGPGRLDWLGLVLAAAGTVGVTYGLSESASVGTFTSRRVILPIVAGLAMLGLFVWRSHRFPKPLLDLGLYRIRSYSAASVVMFFMGAAMFGAMILLPLYFQVTRGQDAIHTGLLMIPQGVGAAIGTNRSAQVTHRFGAGFTAMCGAVIMVVATTPFLFISSTTSYTFICLAMIVRGIGVGLSFMPAMTAAFAALHHHQVSDASPQLNVIQRVGGSLGTAVVAVVLQDKLAHITTRGPHVDQAAVAASFAHTYWWVIGMTIVAVIPSIVLWRIERRLRNEGVGTDVGDETLMEVRA
jgi:EmrB/QacA subfamily drug resistance transporter